MATEYLNGQLGSDQATFRGMMSFEVLQGCERTSARAAHQPFTGATTIHHLFKQWESLFRRINEEMLTEADSKRITAQMVAIEQAMFALPPETAADFMCQVVAFTDCGSNFADDRTGTGHRMVAAATHLLPRAA